MKAVLAFCIIAGMYVFFLIKITLKQMQILTDEVYS